MALRTSVQERPLSIDAHPRVVEYRGQLQQFADSLAKIRSDRAALAAQRQTRVREQVDELVASAGRQPPLSSEIRTLDEQLIDLVQRERTLELAEAQFKTTGPAIREAARAELAAEVRKRASVVVRQVKPLLENLEGCMAQLEELQKLRLASLPVGAMGMVRAFCEKWRKELASFGG